MLWGQSYVLPMTWGGGGIGGPLFGRTCGPTAVSLLKHVNWSTISDGGHEICLRFNCDRERNWTVRVFIWSCNHKNPGAEKYTGQIAWCSVVFWLKFHPGYLYSVLRAVVTNTQEYFSLWARWPIIFLPFFVSSSSTKTSFLYHKKVIQTCDTAGHQKNEIP